MILLVDNYDSFTYNLEQYLMEYASEVVVRRNDAADLMTMAERATGDCVVTGTWEAERGWIAGRGCAGVRETKADVRYLFGTSSDWRSFRWDSEPGREN